MIRTFISYYKPYKGLFAADMIAALLVAGADLFYPSVARTIINDFVPDRNLRMVLLWAGLLLGIYLVKLGMQFFMQYMGHVMGTRMQADMRRDLFVHLQILPLSFFDENKTGTIMSRIINDANVLCMGERVTGPGLAASMADIFLETPFEGGRHLRRITIFN